MPVQLGDDQRIALATSGKRLIEPWPGPVRSSQPLIDINPIRRYAQLGVSLPLRGQVLFVREASCVADESLWHNLARLAGLMSEHHRTRYVSQGFPGF